MRAIGYLPQFHVTDANCLVDLTLVRPVPFGHDVLVAAEAVGVNPKDVKTRASQVSTAEQPRVLGWDAAGVVVETGRAVTLFRPGDRVFYAGAGDRPGCNAEFHLVDERIVALRPATLSAAQAAALPLTALTAYEALFHRLDVHRPVSGSDSVLVIGAGGGVGSIAIQLLRALTGLTVIGTASHPASARRAQDMGAHHVINHTGPMTPQLVALGLSPPGHVFSIARTAHHLPDIAALIAPQGRLALIDDPVSLDVGLLKAKSCSVHWEAVFTRSLFQTGDMQVQHDILMEVAALVDAGRLRSTMTDNFGPICAQNLRRAHARLESGTYTGKIVLSGWPAA